MVYRAVDIADYVVSRCIDTSPISNLQLNKILYFIQRDFLQRTPDGLFREDFEAWQFGPVVPEVYYRYCGFGGAFILGRPQTVIKLDKNEERKVLEIVDSKSRLMPWELVKDTHKEGHAWDLIYKNGSGAHRVIPKYLIKVNG